MKEHLRICFVAFMFSPVIGGAEARAEKQARQLQALGHEVTIITLRIDRSWRKKEFIAGLPVLRVGGIYRRNGKLRIGRLGHFPIDIALFQTLWQLRHTFDVIHAVQVTSLAAVVALFGKLTGIPCVISTQCAAPNPEQGTHVEQKAMLLADTLTTANYLQVEDSNVVADDISYLPRSAYGGRLMLRFLRQSDAYFQALSTRSKAYLAAQGFRKARIVHISGSVNTETFQPLPALRPHPLQPERTMLCIARLEYSKGIDVLLHAWSRMLHAPDAWRTSFTPQLLLIGDGVLRRQLERMVADLAIQDSVTFLGAKKTVLADLQKAWGFVLPSRWEGMPNALLEAMACGLPCVATRVSGSEDILISGQNGLLVEPEQPIEMAQALRHIIEDADLAQRLGAEARATVERDYQLTTIVASCLELYRRMLHTSKRACKASVGTGGRGEEDVGALCLSWSGSAYLPQDEDKHKAPSSSSPRPLVSTLYSQIPTLESVGTPRDVEKGTARRTNE